MMNYIINILTFILWCDFLQRRFPKIEKLGNNIYILMYTYFELLMKKNGIDVFFEPQIEKVSIIDNDYDNKDENDIINNNKTLWDILNKHRTMENKKCL